MLCCYVMMRPWPQWHAYTLAPPLYITFSTSLAPAGIQDERCYIGETLEDSLYGECPCDSPEQFTKLSSQLNAFMAILWLTSKAKFVPTWVIFGVSNFAR